MKLTENHHQQKNEILIVYIIGGILGGVGGAIVGADKTIQIQRKSDVEIKEILQKLRKKARVRNFQ